MPIRKSLIWLTLVFLFLVSACGTQQIANYQSQGVSIDSTLGDGGLDSIIAPYRVSMEAEMSVVIGEATVGLEKSNPESPLGNFAADAAFEAGLKYGTNHPEIGRKPMLYSMALLNFGGLRAPINKGEITLGNMYELMPFDNTLVLVRISGEMFAEMIDYLYQNNGQPVSNASFSYSTAGNKVSLGGRPYKMGSDVIIITTDYLANGGDRMDFLKDPLGKWDTGKFLRDVFIEYVKEKQTLGGYETEGRIQIES